MAGNTKEISRRIKSIRSTRKITKAMEMVAASKMKKAQAAALRTREYAEKALEILSQISNKVDAKLSPLLKKRDGKGDVLVIAVSSSKGLCGGLNSNIFKKIEALETELKKEEIEKIKYISVGKKVSNYLLKTNREVLADFSEISEISSSFEIMPIARLAFKEFLEKRIKEVKIVYTHFKSTISQLPVAKHIIPLNQEILENFQKELGVETKEEAKKETDSEYIIEPSPKEILDNVIPSLVETQIFQSILESEASEHSARMMAMKNASDSANDILDQLQLDFNQMRQAAITQEIAEIVAGASV